MMQRPPEFFKRLLPHIVSVVIVLGTLLFLMSFLSGTWQTISATETVLALKNTVTMESLDRARFNRVLKSLTEKMAERNIDWEKLHDPF